MKLVFNILFFSIVKNDKQKLIMNEYWNPIFIIKKGLYIKSIEKQKNNIFLLLNFQYVFGSFIKYSIITLNTEGVKLHKNA